MSCTSCRFLCVRAKYRGLAAISSSRARWVHPDHGTALTPFYPPPQTTNPGGSANQAVVDEATGIAGIAKSKIQQAFSAVPSALQSAAAAAPARPLRRSH